MEKRSKPAIFIVSDGRGETCAQFVKAALVQFEGQKVDFVKRPRTLTTEAVRSVVEEAAGGDAIVFYTLVSEETRKAMKDACAHLLVPSVDVLQPAFSALHDLFHSVPLKRPGLLYELERENFDRINAIDYTLKHDDGRRPDELDQADVVLVGVSRSSKSSTCFYLAYQGIKSANLPLLPDVLPPPELMRLDPDRVIGLRINVIRLRTVREARMLGLGMDADDVYVDKREIAREVREANALMDRFGWRSVDVSYKAIEEIAKRVIQLRGFTHSSPALD